MKVILATLAMLLFGISAAAASQDCMTLREARHAYHGEHLWWHPSDDGRCWDNTHGGRHHKIQNSGGVGESRPERYAEQPRKSLDRRLSETVSAPPTEAVARVAPGPPDASASMIEAAAATLGPRAIQIAMVGTTFNDRWPEAQPSISPWRWFREFVEFQ